VDENWAQTVDKMRGITPKERVPADPKARLKLMMLFLSAIALYLLWEPALDYLIPLDDSSPHKDQIAVLRLRFIAIFGFSAATSLLFAYGAFRGALRIRRSGQFPAPGASMPFGAVVQRGKEAQAVSVSFFFLAGIGVLSAVGALWALSVMLDFLS